MAKEKEEKTKKINKNTKKKEKKESYFAGVVSELKKVKWPTKKEVLKYTIATIIFILVLVGLFILMSLVMSLIKGAL